MSAEDKGIGRALDRCSWDYEPPKTERRFFLKPMSAFFGVFSWQGSEGRFPIAEPARSGSRSTTEKASERDEDG